MDKKKQSKSVKEEAKKLTEKLLELMGVDAKVDIEDKDQTLHINIEGEDLGLLIGYRGENIESLQLILGLMVNKKIASEDWCPIVVDIGGWRAQKEEYLKDLVETEIKKLESGETEIHLQPMSPSQRRTVHIIVGEKDGLVSESAGEGSDRHVVIRKG